MATDWKLFTSAFALIFVAELPDKTAFATLLLATRRNPYAVFIGVALAFLVQSLVAVLFGNVFALFPARWVHLATGILFLVFALSMLKRHPENEEGSMDNGPKGELSYGRTVWTAFIVIFIAEWGDLTQLATLSLIAHYKTSTWTIFTAATLALWSVTALAIVVGNRAKDRLHPVLLRRVAALAYFGVGVYMILSWSTNG